MNDEADSCPVGPIVLAFRSVDVYCERLERNARSTSVAIPPPTSKSVPGSGVGIGASRTVVGETVGTLADTGEGIGPPPGRSGDTLPLGGAGWTTVPFDGVSGTPTSAGDEDGVTVVMESI